MLNSGESMQWGVLKAAMVERYYQILEEGQRFPGPLSVAAFEQISTACQLHSGLRVLDLGCGGGEVLCRWAQAYSLKGTGVDWRAERVSAAQTRANELEVWPQVHFVESDIASFPQDFHEFDRVICLAGSAMVGGLAELLEAMQRALRTGKGGYLLLGESFWRQPPTPEDCAGLGLAPDALLELPALVDALLTMTGGDLLGVWLAEAADWDAYYGSQWQRAAQWLADHAADRDAPGLRAWLHQQQHHYFALERRLLGWGAFLIRVADTQEASGDEDGEGSADWL